MTSNGGGGDGCSSSVVKAAAVTAAPPPSLTVACRILRSPSHESVTTTTTNTDHLSLFSVSTMATVAANEMHQAAVAGRRLLCFSRNDTTGQLLRGHSPNPEGRLTSANNRPADIPEILWFEEENDLIRSCAALCNAVGLQKSFSTSDISQLPSPTATNGAYDVGGGNTSNVTTGGVTSGGGLRSAVSDLVLNSLQRSGQYLFEHSSRLDHTSRSCSTWVAVGDVASTSQLPSPHGGHTTATTTTTTTNLPPPPQVATPPLPLPVFTAADFIRSVNKKVRQNYIRRRLLTTYKALERLSQSEFNLDRIEVTPSAAAAATTVNAVTTSSSSHPTTHRLLTVPGTAATASSSSAQLPSNSNTANAAVLRVVKQRANNNLPLTLRDVERERGKPLSKYERNMMIFNWLHTLDETAVVEGVVT